MTGKPHEQDCFGNYCQRLEICRGCQARRRCDNERTRRETEHDAKKLKG